MHGAALWEHWRQQFNTLPRAADLWGETRQPDFEFTPAPRVRERTPWLAQGAG
jgi:hypothetical protein